MNTSTYWAAALIILGLTAAPGIAQTQSTTTTTSGGGYVQTSKIVGMQVKTAQGEEVGVVKDVVIDRSTGCMAYTVLSTGGAGTRVTGQAKLVAVPWTVYNVSPDVSFLTVRVERDRIYNAPAFEYSRIEDVNFSNSVFTHFGVSAQGGVSAQTSVSGSAATTTGATAATASPMQSAAPSATAPGAYGTASPSATAAATVSATASPAETASPRTRGREREASPSPAGKARASATPRRHTETTRERAEESPAAESAESPAGEHKRTSHKRAPEETAEPSVTPEEQE